METLDFLTLCPVIWAHNWSAALHGPASPPRRGPGKTGEHRLDYAECFVCTSVRTRTVDDYERRQTIRRSLANAGEGWWKTNHSGRCHRFRRAGGEGRQRDEQGAQEVKLGLRQTGAAITAAPLMYRAEAISVQRPKL